MQSLFILVPLALVFVAIAVRVYFWAVDSGQFDDLETEAQRILFDDELLKPKVKAEPEITEKPEASLKSDLSSSAEEKEAGNE